MIVFWETSLREDGGTGGEMREGEECEGLRDNGVVGEREIEREEGPILYEWWLRQEKKSVDGLDACSLRWPQKRGMKEKSKDDEEGWAWKMLKKSERKMVVKKDA
jgi:hypothetical protein